MYWLGRISKNSFKVKVPCVLHRIPCLLTHHCSNYSGKIWEVFKIKRGRNKHVIFWYLKNFIILHVDFDVLFMISHYKYTISSLAGIFQINLSNLFILSLRTEHCLKIWSFDLVWPLTSCMTLVRTVILSPRRLIYHMRKLSHIRSFKMTRTTF